ncbi:MAG: aspartyl-phosphate phosphatase Spo0E family protein [Tepidanaerobacteraceae bacterium]|jgi:hypothetical protein|nr:aspartyl-phosphate phosphatase Spo0E family protein [Tepidanaerobacter sp.]
MKKKPLAEYDKEVCILNEIEKTREEMHKMIKLEKSVTFDDETIMMSQHLDKLIVEYLRYSGGKQSGE